MLRLVLNPAIVCFISIMNAIVPLLNRWRLLMPRRFGC